MNGKRLLDSMNDIDMKYVEEASYPAKKKRTRRTGLKATVACLILVLALGTAAYASGAVGALRSYFSPQNSNVDTLLSDGTSSVESDQARIWVDNFIADHEIFVFTISTLGLGDDLGTMDMQNTAWVTKSGERVTEFNMEVGAYTSGFEIGHGASANALSMYDDADATFIMIHELPQGYTMEDMEGVEVTCRGLSIIAEVGDALIDTYELQANGDNAGITNLTASAIGFSFTADHEVSEICMIRNDGTYDYADDGQDNEGFHGYSLGTSTNDGSDILECRGNWGGDDAIAIGILDLDLYSGICIDGIEYFFVR